MYFGQPRSGAKPLPTSPRHPAVRRAQELVVSPCFCMPSTRRHLRPDAGRRRRPGPLLTDKGALPVRSRARSGRIGCRHVEIGHAERRRIFVAASSPPTPPPFGDLTPILCGDPPRHRRVCSQGAAHNWIRRCPRRPAMASGPVVVAYEPQWAIGAAEPALPITSPTCRGRCAAIWTDAPARRRPGDLRRQRRAACSPNSATASTDCSSAD
jgi:triosephosphate isomerase